MFLYISNYRLYLFSQIEETRIIQTLVISTLVILVFASILILAILKYRRKQREYNDREQTIANELIQASLEAKEQVMEDIADQLHINVQQDLTLVKIHLDTLLGEQMNKGREKLQSAHSLLQKGIQELKSLSRSIDPKMITGHTLEDNISRQLDWIKRKAAIHTVFRTSEKEIELGDQKQILLYRIVQEAINNIISHANATEICIDLKNETKTFLLHIQDNGNGFDMTQPPRHNLGLTSILRRAALMHGECTITSQPGEGTQLYIRIPYDK